MVVEPAPNYDDEVSTLSFMGHSVQTGNAHHRDANTGTRQPSPHHGQHTREEHQQDLQEVEDATNNKRGVEPEVSLTIVCGLSVGWWLLWGARGLLGGFPL